MMGYIRFACSVALASVLFLAACDSAEERAEEHYESAIELVEAGDVGRATVELRNVFQLNPGHIEARRLFAKVMWDAGDVGEAYASYRFVSEQRPEDLDARRSMARIAFQFQDWAEFERHASRAYEIAPEDPEVRAFWLAMQFRDAIVEEDEPARRDIARQMAQLEPERPDDRVVRQVIIDNLVRERQFREALLEIDRALENDPDDERLLRLKLSILRDLGEDQAVADLLLELIDRFPDDENYSRTLVAWYLSRGETQEAEDLLRRFAEAEDAAIGSNVSLVQFIQRTKGREAALEEIDQLLQAGRFTEVLRGLKAGLIFDGGDRDAAIAELEDVLATAEPSSVTNDLKVTLARMFSAMGNEVGARQQIEEVLSQDSGHVQALMMQARWLIDQDETDDAIIALRRAMDQEPRNADIMTLTARAHLRNGNRELAGEMLSLAVDASNNAPEETVRYARFLIEDDRLTPAESILVDSLRATPGNLDVLVQLGRVYLGQQDWPRLEQVEGTMRRLETEAATRAADGLRLARLQSQERSEDVIGLLEGLIEQQGPSSRASLEIVRTHLRNNDPAAAEAFLDQVLADDPSNLSIRFLKGVMESTSGDAGAAEATYRSILAEAPRAEQVWRALYLHLGRQGEFDKARGALEEALVAIPDSANLQWALAGELERDGDVEGAILIYEDLYARNSNSLIVANNLASLITTYRDSDEDLDRAYTIARRLRGIEQPSFQDTYGWIALRRGDIEEALEHLEPAAAALDSDPLVQFHLGMAYAQAGRSEEAIQQLQLAIDLAGPADTRPQFQTAREEIRKLETQETEGQSQ